MDTKLRLCLLLIILGALTVQGAVSGKKKMNPLHARQYFERECMHNEEEMCFPYEQCPPDWEPCYNYDCGHPDYGCCCKGGWY